MLSTAFSTLRRFFYSLLRTPINFLFTLWERGESVVCLIEQEGKILFIRGASYPSLWALPGGRMKKGESPIKAVVREVEEETGINLQNPKLFGEQTSRRNNKIISRTHCFYSKIENQELTLDKVEILEAQWFSWENLPKPQSLTAERAINLFKENSQRF